MLGMDDGSVFAAYALCILSALLCVVFGIVNWNKGGPVERTDGPKAWNGKRRGETMRDSGGDA